MENMSYFQHLDEKSNNMILTNDFLSRIIKNYKKVFLNTN